MNAHDGDPAALARLEQPLTAAMTNTNGNLPSEHVPAVEIDDLGYDPVPPRKTITLSVRYHLRRRGQPLPGALDEGDGE